MIPILPRKTPSPLVIRTPSIPDVKRRDLSSPDFVRESRIVDDSYVGKAPTPIHFSTSDEQFNVTGREVAGGVTTIPVA